LLLTTHFNTSNAIITFQPQVGDAQTIIYTIFIYWGGAFYTYPELIFWDMLHNDFSLWNPNAEKP